MAIEFEGLDEILDSLDKLADTQQLNGTMEQVCALVERDAKQNAPKDTGALARSIQSKVENNNDSIQGVVFTPLEYAPYVEFGTGLFAESGGRTDVPWAYKDDKTGELIFTSGQKPQPYMRPAINNNREKIVRMIKEGFSID